MNEINQGQNFLDMVLQLTGSCDNAIAMAVLNGCSITDDFEINQKLTSVEVSNDKVVEMWNEVKKPATGTFLILNKIEMIPGFPGMLPIMLS